MAHKKETEKDGFTQTMLDIQFNMSNKFKTNRSKCAVPLLNFLNKTKQQESVQAPCLYASISLLIKTVRRKQLMGALHIPPYF